MSLPDVSNFVMASWLLFWLYWFISASRAKQSVSGSTAPAGFRVALVFLVLVFLRPFFRSVRWVPEDGSTQVIGLVLFVAGIALAVWARIYIGRNWGMPMARKKEPELVTTGPYRMIRHPIYTGILLATAGSALATSLYWLAATVLLGIYFIYSAVVEERQLAATFPKTYPDYRERTKMLLPFIL